MDEGCMPKVLVAGGAQWMACNEKSELFVQTEGKGE